jgi:MATE family multidrug resistance protein
MVPLGLATATAVLVGNAYGARDRTALNRAAAVGFAVAAAFGLVATLVVGLGAHPIALAFTHDPAAVALSTGVVALSALFLVPDALQVVTAQALRSRADVLAPTVTHFASYAAIMIPLAWVFAVSLGLGVPGIIDAIIAASFVSAGLLLARFWMLRGRI